MSPADPPPPSPAPERALRVHVTGLVQGVAFRWHTRERAQELGVAGWVRNLPDGSVEAQIEGAREAVQALVAWLHEGPPFARVEHVTALDAPPEGESEFRVRR